jgi:hypothetical protein
MGSTLSVSQGHPLLFGLHGATFDPSPTRTGPVYSSLLRYLARRLPFMMLLRTLQPSIPLAHMDPSGCVAI